MKGKGMVPFVALIRAGRPSHALGSAITTRLGLEARCSMTVVWRSRSNTSLVLSGLVITRKLRMVTGARKAVVPLVRLCSNDILGRGGRSLEDQAQAAWIRIPYEDRRKMTLHERRSRGLIESSRGFRICMGPLG